VPEPHAFAVRSFLHQTIRPAICDRPKFWRRRSAPFVYTLSIAHGKPPCEHACAPDAGASIASHPNVS
jgi:hypothetical protein